LENDAMTDKNGKFLQVNDFILYDEKYLGEITKVHVNYVTASVNSFHYDLDFEDGDMPYVAKISKEEAVIWKLMK
jgi:hypothetical protein